MFSLKLTTLLVLAIFPFAMGVFDPVATFLSGDYDANDLMNSIAMDIRPGEVLHTEKDEIKDVSEDISFWCSNQQRQIPIKTMVDDSSLESKVDLKKPFTFIVHGWIDNGNRTWIKNLTSSYWKFVDTNVCVVDWDRLANYRYDIAAKTNTKIVGNYIAEFIKGLVARKVDLDDITVVGHSLGGQAAAFTGQALDGKLGTIYGLDPAGPFFTHPIMHYPSERLDSSDAKFVQVIFTTKGFLGASIACGHQNFFPNEGKFLQPGCETPEESFGVKMNQVECSYLHSQALFRYSLNPKQPYTATRCKSYVDFKNKLCVSEPTDRMGIHSSRASGDYYLKTSSAKPFLPIQNTL